MYDLEKSIRHMIVNIIREQNKEVISTICTKFNLNEEQMMQKYLIPYYYMPIIEREIKKMNIE
tara:strand:+ start:764 stop:952 length:189 start_codon:yes stop_codon:yes gene_type:complete